MPSDWLVHFCSGFLVFNEWHSVSVAQIMMLFAVHEKMSASACAARFDLHVHKLTVLLSQQLYFSMQTF